MRNFIIRSLIIVITISRLCLAYEFGSTSTQIPTIQIQGLYTQQPIFQQSIPSCQAYKHRNNICLYGIGYKGKVPAMAAITIYKRCFIF